MELEQKFEKLGQAVEDFKKAHKAEMEEVKKNGTASAEATQKLEKANERISNLENEIKSVQTAMNRTEKETEQKEKASAYQKELNSFLRKGVDISPETIKAAATNEFKDMQVRIDEDGGFLVTPEMSSEVVNKIFETSPMRQLASVQTISTDCLEILEDLDEAEAGWVGETQDRPDTDTPKLKKIAIYVHEIYAQPKATQKLLDDAAVNVESWLAGKISEKFGRIENTSFVKGNGVEKPKGFLAYASGDGFDKIERVSTAGAGLIVGDDLMDLVYSLKGDYRDAQGGAKWLMQRNTVKAIRKLKDGEGQYLWRPGLEQGQPSSLLGYSLFEADDMDAHTSVAANNYNKESIAFGNFKVGYQIVDRIGIRVLRDPYTAKPYIKFYTTKRVGGGVKNFEAIKVLKTLTA